MTVGALPAFCPEGRDAHKRERSPSISGVALNHVVVAFGIGYLIEFVVRRARDSIMRGRTPE